MKNILKTIGNIILDASELQKEAEKRFPHTNVQ